MGVVTSKFKKKTNTIAPITLPDGVRSLSKDGKENHRRKEQNPDIPQNTDKKHPKHSEDMGVVTSKFKKKTNTITHITLQPDNGVRSFLNDGTENHGEKEQTPDIPRNTYKKYPKDSEDMGVATSKFKKKTNTITHITLQPDNGVRSFLNDGTENHGDKEQTPDIPRNTDKKHPKDSEDMGVVISKFKKKTNLIIPNTLQSDDGVRSFANDEKENGKTSITKQECEPENTTNLSQYLNKMTDEARNVLSDHQEKIETVRERIEQIGNEKRDCVSMEYGTRKQEEIRALESKLLEMENQKSEFENFLKHHLEKLEKARDEKKVDTFAKKIYTAFQIECKRLRNALPMYAKRTEISSMVQKYEVSVLLGETGSGKSTQVTQFLYQDGLANSGLIVCTQPRKIAAICLATHVAQEMGTSVGQLVGYKVGMQSKMSPDTKIVYMTDHLLLNECLKDDNLSAYSCIIVDEVHERSIYTDLLLGMIKKCISKRQDLRVVVTSATIDPAVFVEYFGKKCPVLSVAGRMFPVDIVWPEGEYENDNYEQAALEKTIQIHQKEERGDILTFLTSPSEVEKCCTSLTKILSKKLDFICLPLHGRLQANEQQKVFDPPPNGKRKIVFATNSAETSITIPGIKYVIDTGMAREMQFDPKRNINTLCVTNVTKSSADQRKGRAGRTEAGKCFRLYSAETYGKMETSSRPEILRVHLGQALLKLMELGVQTLEFDFVQAPPRAMMNAAMETLTSVGAVINNKITDLGKWIVKLPLDPKFGAFVDQAINEGVGIEAIVLSACCATGGSIFYRSGTDNEKARADKLKVRFCHEGGDLLTMLNVYREWYIQPEKEKGTWCLKNSINGKAIRGIQETVKEVLNVLIKDTGLNLKFKLNSPSDVDQKLQKRLFETFKRNICRFLGHVKAGYLVVEKGRLVQQFPGSPLKMLGLQPDWIVMEQTLKTYSDFAVNVTTVKDEWVQEAVNEGQLQIDLENINKQRVEQVAMFEVGEQIYKDFVGIRYLKLRELEEEIKLKNPDTIAFPLASKELGEIEVYAQQNCEHICTMIKDRIDKLRQQMQQVKSEQFLSPKSGVRVVIGAGLNITDVLMLDEYTSIIIYGNPEIPETKTSKDMIEIFEKYGQIVHIEEFRKNKNKNDWGKITFGKKEDAENAVRMMTANHDISARPSIRFQKTDIHSFRSKLQWCRRPSQGFGFVRFKDPSMVQMCYGVPISVGGTLARIQPSKSHDSEIHVSNLKQNVDEDILRQGFEDALGITPTDVERVTVVRQRVNTSPLVLESFRLSINRKMAEYVQEGTYEVDFRTPKDADYTYLAFVAFSNPEEGQAACRAIDQSFELNNAVVTMKLALKSSVMIPKLVYAKYSTAVDSQVDKRANTEGGTIRKKPLKNGNLVLEIHTNSAETMMQWKSDILMEIKGSIMDLESNGDISRLFSRDGREQIRRVMERTDTFIFADERLFSIAIHGSESGKQSAIKSLTEYLNELKSGTLKKISLRGGDKPPEIMKELMIRYEFDLGKLKAETGLKCLELDLRSHIITVIGDAQSVDSCSRAVEEVIISIIEKRQINNLKPSQVRDCVICFCPIEDGEMYRLEICGHSYCKDCVKFQYKSAIQSNAFPITCSNGGCNKPWAWKDLTGMSSKTGVPVTELVKKATNSFVSQNNNEYRFCSTPDCPLIYRVSERETLFTCPECEVRICTACHGQFHDGVTCKSLEITKEDGDGLKLWMEQNAETAKYCPKCTTPIEKTYGCDHMTCLGCHSHICWRCLEYFASMRECYGHMQESHGSFV